MSTSGMMARLLAKLTSGRMFTTVAVVATICLVALKVTDMMALNVSNPDAVATAKEIFMFIMGAFIATVSAVTTFYFTRSDRWRENVGEDGDEAARRK